MSSGFKVTNGVRQGGILSPYLFCVYADELSRMLNNVIAGCFVGASLVNHLMYADDLVLLAPSAAGLSLLLSACSYYDIEFDVKFNSAKSNVMVFCCNLLKDIPVPNFMLNGVAINKVSNCKYLGHCINDKLIVMMTWLGNVNKYMLRAMHWYESFICVQKLSEFPCSNRIAPLCTPVRYGAITALNRCENYVLHTTMFLEKLPFCLETAVPVSCLPRVICQHVKF